MDSTVRVIRRGRIYLERRRINLSTILPDPVVGSREVEDQVWLVSFLDYGLGCFNAASLRDARLLRNRTPDRLVRSHKG